MIHQYNGKESKHGFYHFDSIKVKSVGGERSEASTGVEGASATKMRKAASEGREKDFHAMAPSTMSKPHKHEMYKDVRRGMGIHESISFSQWLREGMTLPGGGIRGLGTVTGESDDQSFQINYTSNTIVDTDNRNNNIFQRLKDHIDQHNKGKSDGAIKSE